MLLTIATSGANPSLASPHRVMDGVAYDTGALVAAERNNRAMWALRGGFLAEEVVARPKGFEPLTF